MVTEADVADEGPPASTCSPLPLASDQELLFAFADGADWALDLLYQRSHQGLYSLACQIVGDRLIA